MPTNSDGSFFFFLLKINRLMCARVRARIELIFFIKKKKIKTPCQTYETAYFGTKKAKTTDFEKKIALRKC